jgi:DNA-binding CsgD family transcriptional regulator/pimeloyl-ACP methyl ester carboxylesterase
MDPPPVQYVTTSDGYSIAYAVSGQGWPLVMMPEPFNHLHLMWASPVYRSLFEPLAARFQLVQFDPRFMGLSQRGRPQVRSDREHVLDIEAVVDRLDLAHFVLYGPYYFGTAAAEYAARHPDRVDALILWNIDLNEPRPHDSILRNLSGASWDLFIETYARTFNSYEDLQAAKSRMQAAVDNRDHGVALDSDWDVPAMLSTIATPTLVVARRAQALPLEQSGRRVASLIRNSQLVLFDDVSGGRYTSDGSTPGLVLAIEDFVQRARHPEPGRGASPASVASTADSLSAREVEVLKLLAAGRSNQQIADELVISLNTVRRHVSNIFDKTGAANRADAVSYAHRNGIV